MDNETEVPASSIDNILPTSNEEEMKNLLASMESIRKDVPKSIIDMCTLEG